MPGLLSITTDTVTPSNRLVLYQDTLRDLLGPLQSRISNHHLFRANFEYAAIRELGLCKFSASGHHVERTAAMARRYDTGFLKVALQLRGTAYFEQGGRGLTLSPGEWSIYDICKSYRVAMPGEVEMLLMTLPREKVFSNAFNLHDVTVRRFSGAAGVGKLAYQFIRTTFDEIPNLDPQSEPDIVDTIAHLVRLTLIEFAGGGGGPSHLILVERIKSYISDHLRDPELSIDQIAAALNCTKRYLHKAFEHEGVSIGDYIWGLRLDRCVADLLSSNSGQSITQIAFSWGFNSSAHFSTAFRKRFGMSPRQCREERRIPASLQAAQPLQAFKPPHRDQLLLKP